MVERLTEEEFNASPESSNGCIRFGVSPVNLLYIEESVNTEEDKVMVWLAVGEARALRDYLNQVLP